MCCCLVGCGLVGRVSRRLCRLVRLGRLSRRAFCGCAALPRAFGCADLGWGYVRLRCRALGLGGLVWAWRRVWCRLSESSALHLGCVRLSGSNCGAAILCRLLFAQFPVPSGSHSCLLCRRVRRLRVPSCGPLLSFAPVLFPWPSSVLLSAGCGRPLWCRAGVRVSVVCTLLCRVSSLVVFSASGVVWLAVVGVVQLGACVLFGLLQRRVAPQHGLSLWWVSTPVGALFVCSPPLFL